MQDMKEALKKRKGISIAVILAHPKGHEPGESEEHPASEHEPHAEDIDHHNMNKVEELSNKLHEHEKLDQDRMHKMANEEAEEHEHDSVHHEDESKYEIASAKHGKDHQGKMAHEAGHPQHVYEPAHDEEAKDAASAHEEMLGHMSDEDKEDLMSRKPRSLGERAKQHALKKQK